MAAHHPVVIVGSGYAGLQLARQFRRHAPATPLVIVCADDGADYPKPQLSHAISKRQSATDLIRKSAKEVALELKALLLTGQQVKAIDPERQVIQLAERELPYRDLVLAVGAEAWVPPIQGDAVDAIITLNSLQHYQQYQEQLANSQRVLIVGGGLIGSELANDFLLAGKQVTLCDPTDRLLCSLTPDFVSERLHSVLAQAGCKFAFNTMLASLDRRSDGLLATFSDGISIVVDSVECAAGLRPRTTLAKAAGLNINRGIVVDKQLATSAPHIYALGDCAEIDGRLLPYLQPITVSAQALAKTLAGEQTRVQWPVMPVNVKTSSYPVQLAGEVRSDDLIWQLDEDENGLTGQAFRHDVLVGFVTSGQHITRSMALIKQLAEN
ncbi:NADH:flavorubredoxin reductase NorW [uncultured Tolumonas sp.]|uniref:NADH:flavorubredoxin reductase NorW n=1 Tax=uncultured Tolumonas sp. TaxID=263765 RepID=UPI002A0A1D95|nr:NADH:flavorubredoxin reductase NorW [uncultured Tolumonas sp.]